MDATRTSTPQEVIRKWVLKKKREHKKKDVVKKAETEKSDPKGVPDFPNLCLGQLFII